MSGIGTHARQQHRPTTTSNYFNGPHGHTNGNGARVGVASDNGNGQRPTCVASSAVTASASTTLAPSSSTAASLRSRPVLDRFQPPPSTTAPVAVRTAVTITDGNNDNDDEGELPRDPLSIPSAGGRRLLEAKLAAIKAQVFDEEAALAQIDAMASPMPPWNALHTTTAAGTTSTTPRRRPTSARQPQPSSSSLSSSSVPSITTVAGPSSSSSSSTKAATTALADKTIGGRIVGDVASRSLNVGRDRTIYSNLTPLPSSHVDDNGVKAPVYLPGTSRSRSARRRSTSGPSTPAADGKTEAEGKSSGGSRRVPSNKSGRGSIGGGGATLSSARWSGTTTGAPPPDIMDLFSADMVQPPPFILTDDDVFKPLPSIAARVEAMNNDPRRPHRVKPSFSTDPDAGAFMFDKVMLRWA